jgi:hypothetical protein
MQRFSGKRPTRCAQFVLLACVTMCTVTAHGQNFLRNFTTHNKSMKEVQPSTWQGGLATSYVALVQIYRGEADRQRMPAGNSLWNVGNGKGVSLLMSRRVEFDTLIPNYILHQDGTSTDGFSDFSITSKVRLFSGNERHGNYSVLGSVQQTWATGAAKNGAVSGTRVYTLLGGKGFGAFNIESTAGVTIPAAAGLAAIGHPVAWNSVLQAHILKHLWTQAEMNTTFYNGGSHDGKIQTYLTPGIISAGLRPRSWDPTDHKSFTVGMAMQIAATHYRASDHNLILDAKMTF